MKKPSEEFYDLWVKPVGLKLYIWKRIGVINGISLLLGLPLISIGVFTGTPYPSWSYYTCYTGLFMFFISLALLQIIRPTIAKNTRIYNNRMTILNNMKEKESREFLKSEIENLVATIKNKAEEEINGEQS